MPSLVPGPRKQSAGHASAFTRGRKEILAENGSNGSIRSLAPATATLLLPDLQLEPQPSVNQAAVSYLFVVPEEEIEPLDHHIAQRGAEDDWAGAGKDESTHEPIRGTNQFGVGAQPGRQKGGGYAAVK